MNHNASMPVSFFCEQDCLASMAKYGLDAKLRCTSPLDWDALLQTIEYVPVSYTQAMIDYQYTYYQGMGGVWHDCSVVLYRDRKPCAVWLLSISCVENEWRISSSGEALISPLFDSRLSVKTIKSVVADCYRFLSGVASELSCRIVIQEPFLDKEGLGEWYQRAIQEATSRLVRHDLYLDLKPNLTTIRSFFRKSYRPLISSGEKLWEISICREADENVWDEFRLLHLTVAGKVTRSIKTWDAQLQAISQQIAFLVYLRNSDGRMVGGGLFYTSRDEGLYAVGAYDRSLFDKPLGHVVQYHAILEMKKRNLRWYKIGVRPYPSDTPKPSEKEISIADFKQGFSSHLHSRIELCR